MNGAPQLFRNDLPAGHHWVTFRAVGRDGNRDGIGTRITVAAPGQPSGGGGQAHGGDLLVQRPPGPLRARRDGRIDLVTVRWPSGTVQEFRDVAADRHYVLDERDGLSAVASRD